MDQIPWHALTIFVVAWACLRIFQVVGWALGHGLQTHILCSEYNFQGTIGIVNVWIIFYTNVHFSICNCNHFIWIFLIWGMLNTLTIDFVVDHRNIINIHDYADHHDYTICNVYACTSVSWWHLFVHASMLAAAKNYLLNLLSKFWKSQILHQWCTNNLSYTSHDEWGMFCSATAVVFHRLGR